MSWMESAAVVAQSLLEIVIYVMVDGLVKNALRDASNEHECYLIWQGEVVVLLCLSGALYIQAERLPWILLLLASVTFIMTQQASRYAVTLMYRKWEKFRGIWSDFTREYEDFVAQKKGEKKEVVFNAMVSQQNASPGLIPTSPWPPNNYMYRAARLPAEPWYPEDTIKAKTQAANLPKPLRPSAYQKPPVTTNHVAPQQDRMTIMTNMEATRHVAGKFPFGLDNQRSDLCFVNSILQCLAYLPGLATRLGFWRKPGLHDEFIAVFTQLLQQLSTQTNKPGVILNASLLRTAGCRLPNSLLKPLSILQPQEDAAEFLQWLLAYVHGQSNNPAPPTSLADQPETVMLRSLLDTEKQNFYYMNSIRNGTKSTPCLWQKSQSDCKQMRENQCHLAHLEWQHYKCSNQSVVDSIFTGQMVESRRCLSCGAADISCSIFNVLPVPLAEPRLDGTTPLWECLRKLGQEAGEPGGLHCEHCSKIQRNNVSPTLSPIGNHVPYRIADDLNSPHTRPQERSSAPRSSTPNPYVSEPRMFSPFMQTPRHSSPRNLTQTSTPISAKPATYLSEFQSRVWLSHLPDCLILQLCRFTCRHGQSYKDMRPVLIPITNLPLTDMLLDEDLHGNSFELHAMCVHLGQQQSGHYISYAKMDNGAWYQFDDASVKAVDIYYECKTKQIRENAYLFFYCRKGYNARQLSD